MNKLMTKENHTLLKARQLVETVIGSLKHRGGMPNSLPRSVPGYQVHFVITLLAFTIFGYNFLLFLISMLICLVTGFIVGKIAIERRLAFLAGFVAGFVVYIINFMINFIPNYPGSNASGVPASFTAIGVEPVVSTERDFI